MQRSCIPDTIHWRIEFLAGKACRDCGHAIDGDMLREHLDNILRQIQAQGLRIKRAALHFELQQLCHKCHSRWHHDRAAGTRDRYLEELAQRRREQLREYFGNSRAHIVGNPNLREPQINSYRAIQEYFSRGEIRSHPVPLHKPDTPRAPLPAIVEIPTGCGKTGIICTAPFGVSQGRVLIITPNLVIKRSVVKSLAPLNADNVLSPDNFYLKCNIFTDPHDLPKFVVLERGQVNREDLLRADVVVTNIQQIQGWLSPDNPQFESDFFDMIIVDEAHHEPADSWQRVNESFPTAKKVYLTATPFRADSKFIVGSTIYRYRLAQAIANGYVKNIVKVDAIAAKMTFTIHGEVREFTCEEILAMREELWFSKGVALSEVCNRTIIDRSIAIWKRKRQSGVRHQIIGAACSIQHAEQLVELYNERGVRTTHVASEGMNLEERAARIADYEKGIYDCIIHVGILGEGYDNPNISIAAIFRPYRSLSPYAQFVGRAMRWIRGGKTVEDNLAHVVSHVGLNLNFLWEYFKHESRDAAVLSYLDQLFFNHDSNGMGFDQEIAEVDMEFDPELTTEVTDEEIEGYDVDSFLPVEGLDLSYLGPTTRRVDVFVATMNGQGFRTYGQTHEKARKQRSLQEQTRSGHGGGSHQPAPPKLTNRLREQTLPLPFNRPDMERKQYRIWLNKDVQRAAGTILFALNIATDASLIKLIGDGDENNNYEAVVSRLHREINTLMNKDASQSKRNDWTLDELQEARNLVSKARSAIAQEIKRKIQEREQFKLPFEF
ncbi:MAG: DEAD/DEAH box helicase family protein [Abitibacteriaceae bacterium]|nr:DEAD/DEAH box helicase family protein [Abditibacteriaceae bacterium]